jgi:transcriptional regulator with XRE-family HTH domain
MTGEQFKQWRERLSLSQQGAADALGISKGSVVNYESGARRGDQRPVAIPRAIALACAAITFRITPDFSVRDGRFRIVETEIRQGAFGEVLDHQPNVLPQPFRNRTEAMQMAGRVAASRQDRHGYDPEHDYYW